MARISGDHMILKNVKDPGVGHGNLKERSPRRMTLKWVSVGVFALCAVSAGAATSGLWGVNGELWNNTYPSNSISSRIADISHAGYQGGDEPIPFYPVSVVATSYGAIPNDGIDDSAAIQAAIDACPTNGAAIFLPAGIYHVTNTVYINKPNIVLRGAGPAKTVIEALNGISAIKLDGDTSKQGLSMVNGFSRGDTGISNTALANQAQVGDLIYLQVSLSEYDGAAFSNLVEQCVGGVQIEQFTGNVACKMYAKVVGVAGNTVSFDRPLEYSFQGGIKKWGLGIMRPVMHDAGVEDLTVTFDPDYPYAKHFNGTQPGPDYEEDVTTDGIYLQACVNCWVRNVEVREACSAISMYGENVQCTVSDVTLVAERMSQSEFPLQSGLDFSYAIQFDTPLESNYWDVRAHAAVALTGSHMLAERIRLNYAALHDLTINATVNSVFSDVRGFDISLDHHRQNGSRNLYTQIDTGLGRKFWLSSGLNVSGIQCGAWETFWNIDSALEQDFPSWAPTGNAFCRGYINLIGIHTLADSVTNAAPRWFEADIGPGALNQPNLYEAMRTKRFAENGWDAIPPVAVASADLVQGTGSLSVNFSGDSSSDNTGIVSWLWNFGDGYTSWETNAQHTYTAPGIYTAALTVRDARNLRDTQEITITVLESDGLYDLNYRLAGSAELENYALGTGHALAGATNQVVAEGTAASTVIAVPGSGYRFAGWSDGLRTAARTDTNVLQSSELTAYFMEGSSPWAAHAPYDLSLDLNSVSESATNGTLVGTLSAADPDAGEIFTFGLVNDAGGRFAIDAFSGRLTVADAAAINQASNASHSVAVVVVDSTSEAYSKVFTIVVESASRPTAYAQSVVAAENGEAGILLTGSDPEDDPLSYSVAVLPTNGMLVGSPPNLVYVPDAGYTGPDSFAFKVSDGLADSDEATVSIMVNATLAGPLELLLNGSFESGAANFNFAANAGNIPLSAGMAGQWIAREAGEDSNMDLADVSGVVSGQDGSKSMMFQIAAKRGLVQVVDVSSLDVSGMNLSFSAAFASPGREGLTSSDMACYQVIGFNDFAGMTVDLGGTYEFTGGTYGSVVARRTLADSEVSDSAYTPFNENTTLSQNYDYLAVLLGGEANAGNDDTKFVSVDAVQLVLSILETNAVPVASNAVAVVEENGAVDIMLRASDTDGDTLVYIISEPPTNGMLGGIAPDLTYTPNTGCTGSDRFEFYVNDGSASSATAMVSITVLPAVDTDGDGLTDAQEIALGTDPGDPASVFGITGSTALPITGKFRINWVSRSNVLYRILESPDLGGWNVARDWAAALTPPEDTLEFDLSPSNSFFRVEAQLQ